MSAVKHTVLYLEGDDPEIKGFQAQADNPDDAIDQFKRSVPFNVYEVLFAGTGTFNECLIRYQMYEVGRPADVRVYKVVVWIANYTAVILVGADTQEIAWVCAREYLREMNELGLVLLGDKAITRIPVYAREYGILNVELVEN